MPKTTTRRSTAKRPRVLAPGGNGILKTVLPNGLTVVLKENHNAPVATFWVWYRVGSGRERTGITGISHWVEHMLFKGTAKFPGRAADQAVSREGGQWNGFTSLDSTTYFETLPAEKIDLALELEADRMANAPFRPREVASERTVIISEKQGGENNPRQLLGEEVQAAAFRVHGYGHETIGHLCDLQTMTRDDLYTHYRTYYAPNNAVAVAVGAFNAQDMLKKIEKAFGKIKPGPAIPANTAVEPEQRGERRVTVEGPGTTSYVELAYHAPAAKDPDFPAMVALDAILAGASSLSIFGGGTTNASSRLYKALVETELATDAGGSSSPDDGSLSLRPQRHRAAGTCAAGSGGRVRSGNRSDGERTGAGGRTGEGSQAGARFLCVRQRIGDQSRVLVRLERSLCRLCMVRNVS